MKRILVWVLVLQFATGHNMLAELARMPSLLDHLQTHRNESPDLSFTDFLWQHYLHTSHTHSDNSHAQLPLNGSHGIMAESVLPQPPEIGPCSLGTVSPGQAKIIATDETLLPSGYASGLFRPPIA